MNRVIYGDCRDTLRDLIVKGVKVQCCVTSPPYYGLRDYQHPGQLGLEATPDEYVANMVEVFRLVRDLLADDGTLWIVIGDSYSNIGKSGGYTGGVAAKGTHGKASIGCGNRSLQRSKALVASGLKPKDLIGIPWMLAFALRNDGWYLRQDIVWSKPGPMPESVKDRCCKSHEYIFLLSKSAQYFFDIDAMKEPAANSGKLVYLGEKSFSKGQAAGAGIAPSGNGMADYYDVPETRTRRSVWTVPTRSYSGAHFATFPSALIEPMILAGSRPGDIVLDPFMGSGTTAQVSQALGRRWIGCEIQEDYSHLIQRRTAQTSLLTCREPDDGTNPAAVAG
jgi:DNA modification methylase